MKHAALARTDHFWVSLQHARTAIERGRGPLDECDARRLNLAATLLTARDLSILTAALSDPAIHSVDQLHRAFGVATRNAGVPGIGRTLDATLELAGGAVAALEQICSDTLPAQMKRELVHLQCVLSSALRRVVVPSLSEPPLDGVPLLRDGSAIACLLLLAFATDDDCATMTRAELKEAARRARIWTEHGEPRDSILTRTRETARRSLVAGVDGIGDALLELVVSSIEYALRAADKYSRLSAIRRAARDVGRIQISPTGDRYVATTEAGRRCTLSIVTRIVRDTRRAPIEISTDTPNLEYIQLELWDGSIVSVVERQKQKRIRSRKREVTEKPQQLSFCW